MSRSLLVAGLQSARVPNDLIGIAPLLDEANPTKETLATAFATGAD